MASVAISSLLSEIYVLTGRSDLVGETSFALRTAISVLHRSGKFWKDLRTDWLAASAPVEPRSAATQVLDLSTTTSPVRTVQGVRADGCAPLSPTTADDLIDQDGCWRSGVFWGLGSVVNIRSVITPASWEVTYLTIPRLSAASSDVDDWLVDEFRDLVVAEAAAQLLAIIGDQEVGATVKAIAQALRRDLVQDDLQIGAS